MFLPGSIPIVAIVLVGLRDMGVLLLTCPRPAHCKAPVGREHGRSIPFADIVPCCVGYRGAALEDLRDAVRRTVAKRFGSDGRVIGKTLRMYCPNTSQKAVA